MSGLFTVLLATKDHIDAIRQDNKLFFEPFLENNNLAFCYWNPSGQSLSDSAPGLLDTVGRRKNWRAVIIDNVTEDSIRTQNPFDVVDYSSLASLSVPQPQPEPEESLEEWEARWKKYYDDLASTKEEIFKTALEHPLQKLSTWLCFRPTDYVLNEVQEKQDVHDWAMEQIGRDSFKASARLEMLERNHYKNELRTKEKLRRAFVAENTLNIAYPSEIHCISIRTAESNFFDPDTYWNIRSESEYSTFTDRNMYFDKMRFMVFDLLPRTHRNFRSDYIRFLASVLIFISNPIPSSALQARRLYQMEVETDDTPLCILATSYDRKLAATTEVIDSEMERIRSEIPGEMTDKAVEAMFCTPKDITVQLDESCDPEKVYVEKDYGLFFDSPENELHKWNRSYNTSEKALSYIAKQQIRSVRRSVHKMQLHDETADVNISRLNVLQIEDIRDYTNAAEDEMVASIPPDLTDLSTYTQRMSEKSENVKKTIRRRMTKKTGVILSVLCLGLYLLCFLPFVFANSGSSNTLTTAIILSGSMLAALAVAMFVCLFCLRSSVRNAVKDYNATADAIMSEIQSAMKRFSRYLSASYNVRRGKAVQNYAQKNLDEFTMSLRIRKKHREDIRKRRAYLAEDYQDFLCDHSFCDETMSRPYEYDFNQQTEYTYPAPFLAGDVRQIEFISSGNLVTVPFSYVTRILVRMEGIYEK